MASVKTIRGGRACGKVGQIPAALAKILIAGGTFLAIPALFVDQDDGRQQRQPLDGEGHMGQVGDGAVAILKVKRVEEMLGALAGDFAQRLLHRKRGSGVLRHGIGQDFRVGSMYGIDIGLVSGFFGRGLVELRSRFRFEP